MIGPRCWRGKRYWDRTGARVEMVLRGWEDRCGKCFVQIDGKIVRDLECDVDVHWEW